MATDPVCGMKVDEKSAAATRVHQGNAFYFCSARCADKFDANPGAYLNQAEPAHTHKPTATTGGGHSAHKPAAGYTCPMHPEVRQPGPGACPKCGMALRRKTPN